MRTRIIDNNYTPLNILCVLFAKGLLILALGLGLQACSKSVEGDAEVDTELVIPDSDIYLAPLQFGSETLALGAVKNITSNPGYDNQPFFLPDNNTILFTSQRGEAPHNGQSDIYGFYIDAEKTVQVTQTPESEYSPTLTPHGERISVVRVEMDSTQRLWEFPLTEGTIDNTTFKVVFPEVKRVGYHAWTDVDTALLFLVDAIPEGDQHTLEKASRSKEGSQIVATKIGRSLVMRPEHRALSFVDKSDDDHWMINLYDLETSVVTQSLTTLSGSEDLVWLDANNILMAKGQSIYLNTLDEHANEWRVVFSDATQSIEGEITRLAVSPDRKWLAFVVSK